MTQEIPSKTKERWFIAVLFMLLMFVFAGICYGFEFFLEYEEYERELGTTERIQMAAKKAGAHWDDRDKTQVIEDLKRQGKKAWAPLAAQIFVETDGIEYQGKKVFPFGSISHTTNVFCNEMGDWSVYESDEYGFNNPTGQWNKGKVDIALVGDSFVHGACLKQGDDMANQLRKVGLKTLNMGIGGTGPLIYNAVLREYAAPVKPKYVFWFHYAVDIRDSMYEKKSPTLVKYLDDQSFSQNLMNRHDELDRFLEDYFEIEYTKKLDQMTQARKDRKKIVTQRLISQGMKLHKLRQRFGQLNRPEIKEGYEEEKLSLLRQALVSAKKKTESWGGKFVFVFLPDWYTYGGKVDSFGIKIDANFLLRQDVLKLVSELEIPIIDIQAQLFDKHPDPVSLYNFRTYGHYTLEGYTLVVRELETYLKQNAKNLFAMKASQK